MARNTQATETNAYSGWDSVRLAVDSVTSGQLEHFEPSTIANVIDVLSACERRTKLLLGLKKGYWPTVVLWWNKLSWKYLQTERTRIDSMTKTLRFGTRNMLPENHSRRDSWLN